MPCDPPDEVILYCFQLSHLCFACPPYLSSIHQSGLYHQLKHQVLYFFGNFLVPHNLAADTAKCCPSCLDSSLYFPNPLSIYCKHGPQIGKFPHTFQLLIPIMHTCHLPSILTYHHHLRLPCVYLQSPLITEVLHSLHHSLQLLFTLSHQHHVISKHENWYSHLPHKGTTSHGFHSLHNAIDIDIEQQR